MEIIHIFNKNRFFRRFRFPLMLLTLLLFHASGYAQFLMDMVDTSTETGKGLLNVYKKFDHLRIGGYIQPQFQLAGSKGVRSFEGTDFATNVNNRFMLRRSRVRIDYINYGEEKEVGVQVAFQFDVNERGFTIRDVWGRVFENKFNVFSLATGMFARPFGYEVNLSSGDRESPERGRMSQILMKSERDLGAMISFDPRKKNHRFYYLKADLGIFNGQGINATGDFDNHKDLIARVSLKPYPLSKKIILSAGLSALRGGLLQNTKYKYYTGTDAGVKKVLVDSAFTNTGGISPRNYYGADVQIKIRNKKGFTELRGEYITGTQTGTLNNTETPVALITGNDGFHIRNFNGVYFYFVQNVFGEKNQLLLKYDWYDPNTKVAGKEIGATGSNFTATNIKFSTLGFGYIRHLNEHAKLVLYYARVWNETTQLSGFASDIKDDVMTFRIQYRF